MMMKDTQNEAQEKIAWLQDKYIIRKEVKGTISVAEKMDNIDGF